MRSYKSYRKRSIKRGGNQKLCEGVPMKQCGKKRSIGCRWTDSCSDRPEDQRLKCRKDAARQKKLNESCKYKPELSCAKSGCSPKKTANCAKTSKSRRDGTLGPPGSCYDQNLPDCQFNKKGLRQENYDYCQPTIRKDGSLIEPLETNNIVNNSLPDTNNLNNNIINKLIKSKNKGCNWVNKTKHNQDQKIQQALGTTSGMKTKEALCNIMAPYGCMFSKPIKRTTGAKRKHRLCQRSSASPEHINIPINNIPGPAEIAKAISWANVAAAPSGAKIGNVSGRKSTLNRVGGRRIRRSRRY